MITKNHPNAYGKLFTKAKEILTQYGKNYNVDGDIVIDDIDDYFCYLQTLAQIEKDHINIDPIFTILPATEATFDIDADKRSITIPANFKDHGVGVQGDEIAEILYFSIDRYFDAMDLADMDIVVQWKHEKDADHVSNLSATYKKSLTLQPGKIVFGWPITSEVTERAGNIKFSIRFYRRNENKLEYSFSTLTATIKIRDGLDFNIEDADIGDIIDRTDMIYKNLRNSTPTNIDSPVATPIFTNCWICRSDVEPNSAVSELEAASTIEYDEIVTLIAKAAISPNAADNEYINSNGLIYDWYNEQGDRFDGMTVFKLVDKSVEPYDSKETYYYFSAGTYIPYAVHGDVNPYDDVDINGEPIDLFVRCGAFKPATAGTYHATALNKQSQTSFVSVQSSSWIIAGADVPVLTLGAEEYILDGESVEITISATVKDNGTLTNKWYKDNQAVSTDLSDTYVATTEGRYAREVSNSRNGVVNTVKSDSVWVHYEASEPVINEYWVNNTLRQELPTTANLNDILSISATATRGDLTYQWFRGTTPIGEPSAESLHKVVQEDLGANLKCRVTSAYAGTTKTVDSQLFIIMG